MFGNYVVIDEAMHVISGSSEFFKFIGALNFDSLVSNIAEHDVSMFRECVRTVFETKKNADFILNMLNAEYEDKLCYVLLSPVEDFETRRAVLMNIYDIKETASNADILKRRTELLQLAVDPEKNLIFEYTPSTDLFYVYRCSALKVYTVYKGKLKAWEEEIISRGRVLPESVDRFKLFVQELKTDLGVIKSELTVDMYNDGSIKNYSVEGYRIVNNTSIDMIGGVIQCMDESDKTDILTGFTMDYMTGVLDKRSIIKYAKDKIATRTNENVTLAILDLDFFKDVNDILGHKAGDQVLIEFAKIISECIKDNGAVGRYGGDEFMVILDNAVDQPQIKEYFRAIRTMTENTFKKIEGKVLNVTTSVGIVPIENMENDFSYAHMFQLADCCLYMAKEYGRNRYIIYDERSKKLLRLDGSVTHGKFEKSPQGNRFVIGMTQRLINEGKDFLEDAIREVSEKFGIDNIAVYLKKDDKYVPEYSYGSTKKEKLNIDYVFDKTYMSKFDENGVITVYATASFEMRMPEVYKEMKKQNINACIQFLIKNGDDVLGVISYEICLDPSRYWQDSEILSIVVISQIMAFVLQSKV